MMMSQTVVAADSGEQQKLVVALFTVMLLLGTLSLLLYLFLLSVPTGVLFTVILLLGTLSNSVAEITHFILKC